MRFGNVMKKHTKILIDTYIVCQIALYQKYITKIQYKKFNYAWFTLC